MTDPCPRCAERARSRAARVARLVSRLGVAVVMVAASVWRILVIVLLTPLVVLAAPAVLIVMTVRRLRRAGSPAAAS